MNVAFVVCLLCLLAGILGAGLVNDWLAATYHTGDAIGLLVLAVGIIVGALPIHFFDTYGKRAPRAKPDGYIGRYRRPDGQIVHVARVNRRLMVVSDTPPGVFPADLGTVTGPELVTWERLGTTPDGNERVPRA